MRSAILDIEEVEPPGTSTSPEQDEEPPSEFGECSGLKKIISLRKTYGAPRFQYSERVFAFRKKFFSTITSAEWNDWRWHLRHRITHLHQLERILHLTEKEYNAILSHRASLPLAITPYYASLLDADDSLQPLRRTVVPVADEHCISPGETPDPLREEDDSQVPGLVHRYPDRVLFIVTEFCSTYCRYCTRSRMVGKAQPDQFNAHQWQRAIAYIEATPTVRDVLLSGGDPLTLSDEKLEWLLAQLRRIPHVEFLRIGTKAPVVLPYRITPALTRMLRRYHPLWMSIHFTHPEEITPEVTQACERLADAGIPLGSQTVLLTGINDSIETMRRLFQGLLRIRVRPYYLYQCDPIFGSAHFRTPVEKGLEIIKGLRGYTSGYAIPTYVIDTPGGGGKIPLLPEYVVGHENKNLVLRNYQGNLYYYPNPGGSVLSPKHVCQ